MAKKKEKGNWVLTRDNKTPDSERLIERDDFLFDDLNLLFSGQQTQCDLEAIGKKHGIKAEEVFFDLHENYGYICIGTGANPSANENLTAAEVIERQNSIESALEKEKIPHILIKGKYMGTEEYSYFIPYCDNTIGLKTVLQSKLIDKIKQIAEVHMQDSLLICQKGHCCYLYTTGTQKGHVVTGNTAVVYADQNQLPQDCYSLFMLPNKDITVAFTCGLNFERIYASVDEFVDEKDKHRSEEYKDFTLSCDRANDTSHKKLAVILRGADGYNAYAINLKNRLAAIGLRAAIVGTDANIAKVNMEVAQDNINQGPKANWKWNEIREEFLRRNYQLFENLLTQSNVDVVIYADMNKKLEFIQPYLKAAKDMGHEAIINVVNSFIFTKELTDFIQELNNLYGNFMNRHILDFCKPESAIDADSIKLNDIETKQLHNTDEENLVNQIAPIFNNNKTNSKDNLMTTYLSKTANKQEQIINLLLDININASPIEVTTKINTALKEKGIAELNKAIDGVGIQLNFTIDNDNYLLIGISRGEVLSVNGGKVEDKDPDLFFRLAKEYQEETFGVINLIKKENKIYLRCPLINPYQDFELSFDNAHLDDHAEYKMCYLTFKVNVQGFSLEQLKFLSQLLTPTALFWNKIGNFLHSMRSMAYNDSNLLATWQSEEAKQKRANFIKELNELHQQCISQHHNKPLLVELNQLEKFKAENFDLALQAFAKYLDELPNSDKFWELKNTTIGDYSERPGYHVVKAAEMKAALDADREVSDVDGNKLAKVFDARTVKHLCDNTQVQNTLTGSQFRFLSGTQKTIIPTYNTECVQLRK